MTLTKTELNERELVDAQGIAYIHIPVGWGASTSQDLEQFFAAMDRCREKRVFVHCALNYRVSAFVFLYRVLRLGVAPDVARVLMLKIWEPHETWRGFIARHLASGRS